MNTESDARVFFVSVVTGAAWIAVRLSWFFALPSRTFSAVSAVLGASVSIAGFLIGAVAVLVSIDGDFTAFLHESGHFSQVARRFRNAIVSSFCLVIACLIFFMAPIDSPQSGWLIHAAFATWLAIVTTTIGLTGRAASGLMTVVRLHINGRENKLKSAGLRTRTNNAADDFTAPPLDL